MFSFLNSGILLTAVTAVLPIIIYLFAKKKPQKVFFSTIRFIKESQRKQKSKINLKNLLLLLIRILIILFTILALARPTIKSNLISKGNIHPKTAVAIIIDNSYSMDYLVDTQTELEKAKNICMQINEILSSDDITVLLTLSDEWNKLYGQLVYGKLDDSNLEKIVVEPIAIPLTEAIELAQEKLHESHIPNQEIYIITDYQKQEIPEKYEIPTFFISTSPNSERTNLSCENVTLEHDFVNKKYSKKINYTVVNHSSVLQEDIICQLFMNGRIREEKVIDLQANQTLINHFNIELDQSGWQSGYVMVKDERLAYDNSYYFSFFYNHTPKIAVVSQKRTLPFSLLSIAEIYTSDSENIHYFNPVEIDLNTLKDYDNIIFYEVGNLTAKLTFIMDNLKKDNRGFLYLTNNNLHNSEKDYLQANFSLKINQFYDQLKLVPINQINSFHPITEIIKDENISVTDFWETKSQATTLLKTQDDALAVAKDNQIIWFFDCESLKNPFLLDSAFPVFSFQTLEFIAKSPTTIQNYQVGSRIPLIDKTIILPNLSKLVLDQPFYLADKPGLYQTEKQIIPVNLNYEESRYNRLEYIKLNNLHFVENDWKAQILRARYGFEIWKWLLGFVLLLFLFEMLLVKSEEKKSQ